MEAKRKLALPIKVIVGASIADATLLGAFIKGYKRLLIGDIIIFGNGNNSLLL